jgi:hypothetical protein
MRAAKFATQQSARYAKFAYQPAKFATQFCQICYTMGCKALARQELLAHHNS